MFTPKERKPGSGLAVTTRFIEAALCKKLQGDDVDYTFIVKQLEDPERVDHRNRWIQGLTGCVDALTEKHGMLVEALLQMDWHVHDDVTASYKELITSLVSAHPGYSSDTLGMLVEQLLPQQPQACPGEQHDYSDDANTARYDAVHSVLSEVLRIVPTSLERAMQLVVAHFPHKLRPVETQVDYLKNVLRMMVYAPNIQDQALALIVDRLVEIDVEIKLDEHMDEEDVFAMEDAEDELEHSRVNEMADKLDEMLKLVYQFFATAAAEDPAGLAPTFRALLQAFEASVLPVHKSKASQFVVFYASSLHISFPGIFLESLLNKVADVTEAPVLRQTCAAYIGSYLARFQPLPEDELRNAFGFLIEEAVKYLAELPHGAHLPDPNQHAVFYTLCQSILYSACYRREQLINIGVGQCTQLNGILASPLDPMRFCLPTVAREFFQVAPLLGIIWDQAFVDRLQEIEHRNCACQLEMFFPFDPYLMDESRDFIDGIYEVWKHGGDEEEMDELQSPRSRAQSELSISGSLASLGEMGHEYGRLSRSNSNQNGTIRPRSLSGMGHTPNSRSFTHQALSNSPGFEPTKIGPYKKRRKAYGSPDQNRTIGAMNTLDENYFDL